MESATLENQLKKTVAPNRIRECLLDSDYMSDVTFILGTDEAQLRAHKMFLSTSSPIFLQLFESHFDECLNVKISSITKATMLEVCRYAYTDNLNLTQANVLDVLYAASKFEMRSLIEKCVDYAGKLLSEKSVFKVLIENQMHNNLRINLKCFEYIEKNHQKCFKNWGFLKISSELLRTIVTTCKVPREAAVAAIITWSKANDATDVEDLMALLPPTGESAPIVQSNKVQPHIRSRSQSRSKVINKGNKQMTTVPSLLRDLTITGQKTHKNFKFANLDLLVNGNKIIIREIFFIYDLKLCDEQFEISLWKVDGINRAKLYNSTFRMSSRCISYRLTREIELTYGAKIWISVEFPESKFRLTYDAFHSTSALELVLREEKSFNSYAQIISKVVYSTKD